MGSVNRLQNSYKSQPASGGNWVVCKLSRQTESRTATSMSDVGFGVARLFACGAHKSFHSDVTWGAANTYRHAKFVNQRLILQCVVTHDPLLKNI